MHLCWRTPISGGTSIWERVSYKNGEIFHLKRYSLNKKSLGLPKTSEFSHMLGESVFTTKNIWFKVSNDGRPMK